jgi:hypothetical protein
MLSSCPMCGHPRPPSGKALLAPYLPRDGAGGSPYSEGGALYALGLIAANHGAGHRTFLLESLRAAGSPVIQHGACLGLGERKGLPCGGAVHPPVDLHVMHVGACLVCQGATFVASIAALEPPQTLHRRLHPSFCQAWRAWARVMRRPLRTSRTRCTRTTPSRGRWAEAAGRGKGARWLTCNRAWCGLGWRGQLLVADAASHEGVLNS